MSNTSYHVKVSDTGTSGEFAHALESVQVPLTAKVIAGMSAINSPIYHTWSESLAAMASVTRRVW